MQGVSLLALANCSVCGKDLCDDKENQVFMPIGEFLDLTCQKCGVVWRFWIEIATRQKKIGQKDLLKSRTKN